MGKDWLHWIGGGGRSGSSSAARGRIPGEMADTSGGCMRAVFQLFDFPNLNPHNNLSDFLPQDQEPTASKGVEAPRNSLELGEPPGMDLPNLPVGIRIKTGHPNASSRPDDFSSESSSNSPGIKTPSVVARLMGLDLLPECDSPRISSATSMRHIKACQDRRKFRNNPQGGRSSQRAFYDDDIAIGAQSLPETPRMSSARRSDFELHHRLSLQINKENTNQEASLTPRPGRRFRFQFQPQDENRSPGNYAKQIVKQVKESVSRRVGLDITNTTKHRDLNRRDENLILHKPTKKNSKILSSQVSPDGIKSQNTTTTTTTDDDKTTTRSPRVSTSDNNPAQGLITVINPLQQQQHKDSKEVATSTRNFSASRLKKLPFQAARNNKEETFVHPTVTRQTDKKSKKSKKTTLSSDVLNISSPILLQAKKDPSPPLTKLPPKQVSNKQSHSYNRADKSVTVKEDVTPCSNNCPSGAAVEYGGYIQKIFTLAGVVSNFKWHTQSHPIDPLIFHRIELFHLGDTTAVLRRRCNRKLVFQLVDELLAEILKPYFQFKPWISSDCVVKRRFPSVEELCRKIDGFPAANCEFLEDIDSLIDRDLPRSQWNGNFEEEAEAVLREIEDKIVERLVGETATMLRPPPRKTGGGHVPGCT